MTYDTLFSDLKEVTDYFLTVFTKLILFINSNPLMVLAVFITVSLPAVYLIFSLFVSVSESTDDFTTDGLFLLKYFRSDKFKKKQKEAVKKFHETKKKMNKEYMSQKKFQALQKKWDNVPLKIPEKYKNTLPSANPSSSSNRRSSANIDVEYDED